MNFVRYVGNTQCSDAEYLNALQTRQSVIVDRYSSAANAVVNFLLDGKPLAPKFSGQVLDLFDLGALVYLADEMVERAKSADHWTREIGCLIPVSDTGIWGNCTQLLQETLHVLSGDSWSFQWLSLCRHPRQSPHRLSLPRGYDAVCLFSGGADSLLGAIGLLEQGRRVILVGHQAEGQTSSAQKELAQQLRRMYPRQTCLVQCGISRSPRNCPKFSLAPKKEGSHRPRSFLFLTLAIAIALKCNIREVFMPENGFMTLNIPLQCSRVGALSTRTTHPAYVIGFRELVSQTCGFDGSIRNPFLTQSKTDMLRNLEPENEALMLRTVSCSRSFRFKNYGVRHCGYCVPCIHRRIAFLEAGIDNARDYAFDIFWNFAGLGNDKQQDLRAVARFAVRVASAGETELQTLVLSQGFFPSNAGDVIGTVSTIDYTPWTQMLSNWARDFLNKLSTYASPMTLDILDITRC